MAVKADQVSALRAHVQEASTRFGQRCLYLQRSGEAELVWADGAEASAEDDR